MAMSTRWWIAPVLLVAASQVAAQSGEWTTYGGNDWNQRYSSLKTITTSNVAQLVPRMIFQTGHREARARSRTRRSSRKARCT